MLLRTFPWSEITHCNFSGVTVTIPAFTPGITSNACALPCKRRTTRMAESSPDPLLIDPALIGEVLIDAPTLQKRVCELGAQVSADYAGVSDLLLVSVLKGSVVFLTDLMRCISVPHAIDFMAVTSYGQHVRQTTGTVRIDMDLRQNIEGRSILVVEDIVDSGLTLDY